ncbi:glutamate racemase [Dictyobacter alpinus]|uniref:Glutamate racemase n=1 Tax=Dictyobacter alpinus TaxID=2014873 RepID=A0A402B6X6_9CHLR|nr:glutamate racemase [Dictyobacter alpinus]GCE27104.1 glutamate racemase [Dictyobacter alpinus]
MHPARDAERSEHIFYDYRKNDPRNFQQGQDQAKIQQVSLAPIGVFDSGAGGLTILTALRKLLPSENFIYIGDTAHCPYGTRSEDEIIELSLQACRFLVEQGVKMIVVACNTASQAALSVLRSTYSIPFIGVVPAVKPAARATRRGRIGIAATNQAVKASYLRHLIDDFASDIQVYAVGCPELVTLVEHGELESPLVDATLQQALQPLIDKDVDVIVLGCTHFPALRPAIERLVGKNVQVIDSGAAIARRTQAILDTERLARPLEGPGGDMQIWCSGDAQDFSRVASAVLGYSVQACQSLL